MAPMRTAAGTAVAVASRTRGGPVGRAAAGRPRSAGARRRCRPRPASGSTSASLNLSSCASAICETTTFRISDGDCSNDNRMNQALMTFAHCPRHTGARRQLGLWPRRLGAGPGRPRDLGLVACLGRPVPGSLVNRPSTGLRANGCWRRRSSCGKPSSESPHSAARSRPVAPCQDTLVVYSFMFPRYSGDPRPGPAEGETARLPLAETPCPSCTSILDSLDGAAPHLAHQLSLAVVAKSEPARIRTFAQERGWCHLRLLSSQNSSYNRDYHAETPEGEQNPVLNVFTRDGDGFRHRWATELMFAPRDGGEEPRHVDSIWPIWNVLDLTPGGRGSDPDFPAMHYR